MSRRALVLDAGALIALERRDRRALALLHELCQARLVAHVPTTVVAQVWRGSPRQHAIVRLLKAEALRVHAFTEALAYRVGVLLAASRTSDVVDAHVALLGRALNARVVTSDPDDLRGLVPDLDVAPI